LKWCLVETLCAAHPKKQRQDSSFKAEVEGAAVWRSAFKDIHVVFYLEDIKDKAAKAAQLSLRNTVCF
jgi:hypothetical protein